MKHTRCPDIEVGWWEVHCFPEPSPLTDGMAAGWGGGGGNERKGPPSHPENPQEPDRKQLQERQQQLGPQPQRSGLRRAFPNPTENENGDSTQTPHSLGSTYLLFTLTS